MDHGPSRKRKPWPKSSDSILLFTPGHWLEWCVAALLLALTTLLGMLIEATLGSHSITPVYLLIVILSSLLISRGPVLFLAFGSTVTWWFFLLPQRFSLRIQNLEDGLSLLLFFIAALASGQLSSLLRSRERRRIEGEMAARLALESQKMQRALLDNFSHELQTPLSILSGVLQRLKGQALPPGDKDILPEAAMALERLRLVVGEMTDLARLERGILRPELEWCDTTDFLQEWLDGKPSDVTARVKMHLPDRSLYIQADTRLLCTALDNVLHNALRHTPPDTFVGVTARPREDHLDILIEDRGTGIPPEEQEVIFERFYRGESESTGGLGLGLPIARQFLELMHGTIRLDPSPGPGACFVISLPCTRKLPMPDAPPA